MPGGWHLVDVSGEHTLRGEIQGELPSGTAIAIVSRAPRDGKHYLQYYRLTAGGFEAVMSNGCGTNLYNGAAETFDILLVESPTADQLPNLWKPPPCPRPSLSDSDWARIAPSVVLRSFTIARDLPADTPGPSSPAPSRPAATPTSPMSPMSPPSTGSRAPTPPTPRTPAAPRSTGGGGA
ncbi:MULTISPECIES: hypothetical protein [Parafrankia]|uniref:hypothetical protein n=1 Tax=Parafrankia TaxID=2994362 RepID=UPI000B222534|nr:MULTISPECIES: hypothetical protein [Parafrankia]MBE3202294.1 hypothetical protein [Parafrankia sp. CH37]